MHKTNKLCLTKRIFFSLIITSIFRQYSYNRRGECDVRVNIIYNRNEQIESTVIQKIYFDTTVNKGIL